MLERFEPIKHRYDEVREQLANPEIISNIEQMASLSREYKELTDIVDKIEQYQFILDSISNTKTLLEHESDDEMRDLAKEELSQLMPLEKTLEDEIRLLLVPKDPLDQKDILLEIRAGTGGDEASLFAGDLLRMYQRFCEKNNFNFTITDFHEGTHGGYKEVIASISGIGCYGIFKFESGVHRVQRIPETETQGRIHTSAATVAVLPEAEEFDVQINEKDIQKETFCSSGAGGQSVNTTYSAVRLTHIPSGIVVSMQNERSQIKNYELALKILKTRIYDMELSKRQSETAEMRRNLVSSGDRSAKIRTYNFPQSRITDHRINLTAYNLSEVLDGQLYPIIRELQIAENTRKLDEQAPVGEKISG